MIHTEKHVLLTEGGFQAFNVTERVRAAVQTAGIHHGSALVYFCHTTGAVIIVEHEAGILVDLEDALAKIDPRPPSTNTICAAGTSTGPLTFARRCLAPR